MKTLKDELAPISNCCGYPVIDPDICSACGEHCKPISESTIYDDCEVNE